MTLQIGPRHLLTQPVDVGGDPILAGFNTIVLAIDRFMIVMVNLSTLTVAAALLLSS
jgi:hypothetical protein